MPTAAKRTAYDKLTQPMQKKFVNEFMVDFNAGRAYVRAGYSPKSADQNAWSLSRTQKVKAALEEAMDNIGITPNRVKAGLAAMAFGDGVSKRVTGPNAHNEQDRMGAMKELGRIMGMVTEKSEVKTVADVHVMFDDGTPAERAAAATKASAEHRKASEGK